MTREEFKIDVVNLYDDYIKINDYNKEVAAILESRAKLHEEFDPKLAKLERQASMAYMGAVNDLMAYIESKTECKSD